LDTRATIRDGKFENGMTIELFNSRKISVTTTTSLQFQNKVSSAQGDLVSSDSIDQDTRRRPRRLDKKRKRSEMSSAKRHAEDEMARKFIRWTFGDKDITKETFDDINGSMHTRYARDIKECLRKI